MTSYVNFVQDFPTRCIDILQDYEERATLHGREVTLSITIATSALIIPFERLRPSATDHIASDRYRECVSSLRQLLKRPFQSWANGSSWAFHPLIPGPLLRDSDHVEQWLGSFAPSPLAPSQTVEELLSLIRNALAHGNIHSFPSTPSSSIENLLFLSKRRDPKTRELLDEYKLLQATPRDFTSLLRQWVLFLKEIDIPLHTAQPQSFAIPAFEDAVT